MPHPTVDLADELFTPKEVATFFKFAEQSLADMRCAGTGPQFIKLGPHRTSPVRYPKSGLIAWIESNNAQEAA